jgi:hypothetical protein
VKFDPACRIRPRATTTSDSIDSARKLRSDRLTVRSWLPGGAPVAAVMSTMYSAAGVRSMNSSSMRNHGLSDRCITAVPELACVRRGPSR